MWFGTLNNDNWETNPYSSSPQVSMSCWIPTGSLLATAWCPSTGDGKGAVSGTMAMMWTSGLTDELQISPFGRLGSAQTWNFRHGYANGTRKWGTPAASADLTFYAGATTLAAAATILTAALAF